MTSPRAPAQRRTSGARSRAIALRAAACFALLFGCDAASGPLGMLRGADVASGVVVELDLSRGVSELAGDTSLFAPSAPSLPELVQTIARAKNDRRTKGFFIRLEASDMSFAQAEELGRIIVAARGERPVVCHAHGYSNVTMMFAAQACQRIWLSPAGEVGTVGLGGQLLYLRRLLDRFNVQADFLHMGKYKSAAETFTQDGPSEPAREALESVLGSIRGLWLGALEAGRPGKSIGEAAEHGPWSPQAALARGMVDAVGFLDEARDDAKSRAGAEKIETVFGRGARRDGAGEVAELLRALAGSEPREHDVDHVAIVTAVGGIGMEQGGAFGSDGINAEPLGKILRRLRNDDSVKAVVLRIDSPGGSALASDLLWHDLIRLRDKKPLIASLAATAASGGYYMACAASRIVAERSTILGSIGVVGGKIVIGTALDDLGITGVTFPASKEPGAAERVAYMSLLTAWDEATRESVRAQMAAIYELFLSRVAKGRALELDHVRNIAEGRIWSGEQGLEHKLIDELGGLTEAIAIAKQQAGLPADAPVKIEHGPEGLLQLLQIEEDADDASIRAAIERVKARPVHPIIGVAGEFRPYAESLLPLLGRERVVVAVPFAFDLD